MKIRQFNSIEDFFNFENLLSDIAPGLNGMKVLTKENDGFYILSIEAPGIDKEDIDISIEDRTLNISFEKNKKEIKENEKVHIDEFYYGSFKRTFSLPKNASENISAEVKKGILNISIEKKEEEKSKKIKIK